MKKKIFTKVLATAMIAPLFLVGCNSSDDKPNSSDSQNQSTETTPSTPVAPVKNTVTLKADENFELKSNEVIVENGKPFKLEVPNLDKMYKFDGWYTETGDKITDAEGNSIENWDETLGDVELTARYYGNYDYEEVGDGLRVEGNEYTAELNEIYIPDEVNGKKVLEVGDFSDHKFTKRVSLPNTVNVIGGTSFSGLPDVEAFEMREIEGVENPTYTSVNGILYADEGATLVRYPLGSETTTFDVPATVTKLAPHAFEGYIDEDKVSYGHLKTVNLPATITEVGDYAFFSNATLEAINFAESTTHLRLGEFAFAKVLLKNGFTIPANTVEIADNCFASDMSNSFKFYIQWDDVVLPEGLKSIGANAFYYNKKLTGITLPSTLETLGENAFGFASSMKTVTFPKTCGITEIPDHCFYKTLKLGAVEIPSYITSIADSAFESSKLTSITLPEGLKSIGARAFKDAGKLTAITIPSTVEIFGESWIANTPSLVADKIIFAENQLVKVDGVIYNKAMTEVYLYPSTLTATSYTMPDTVKVMPEYMFKGNKNLTSVKLSSNLCEIPAYAFYGSTIETIEVPASVTRIGDSAFGFAGGAGVKSITFAPDSQLKIIGKMSFDGTAIKNITLPEGVEVIEDKAFLSSDIEVLNLPSTVKAIENTAFGGTRALKEINVNANSNFFSSIDGVLYNKDQTTIIVYPSLQENKVVVLPETVTKVEHRAFYEASITSVSGSNVKEIGSESFVRSQNLKTVDFPNLEIIGDSAFEADFPWNADAPLTALESIDLSKVKFVGNLAFKDNNKLVDVKLNKNIETIGSEAFAGTSLKSVTLGSKVNYIGESAFANTKLETLTLEEGVTRIGAGAFSGLKTLTSVTLPSTVRYIDADAFNGCGLTKLNIASGVKYIEEGAFAGNPLTEITVDAANRYYKVDETKTMLLTKDGSELVLVVDATEYVIPETVKTFRNGAFAQMTKLEKITVNNQESYDVIFENNEFQTVKTIVVKKGINLIDEFETVFEKVEANQTVEGYDVYTRIPEPTPEA